MSRISHKFIPGGLDGSPPEEIERRCEERAAAQRYGEDGTHFLIRTPQQQRHAEARLARMKTQQMETDRDMSALRQGLRDGALIALTLAALLLGFLFIAQPLLGPH